MSENGLARVARRVDSRILAGFFAIAIIALGFTKLASEVSEGETLGLDRWILQALRSPTDHSVPIGPQWLVKAMIDLTALGGVSVLALLTVLVAGYLVASGKKANAAFVVSAVGSGALVGTLLKEIFARARPDIVAHLVTVDSTSFPSGHAMNSAVTYLTLGALIARTEKRRRVRIYIVAVAIALALSIGFSRVYLGVHYPTDVLGGWVVGAAWAIICSLVGDYLQRRRRIEQPTGANAEESGSPGR
jgi:undecaprenyl-diphosphatase